MPIEVPAATISAQQSPWLWVLVWQAVSLVAIEDSIDVGNVLWIFNNCLLKCSVIALNGPINSIKKPAILMQALPFNWNQHLKDIGHLNTLKFAWILLLKITIFTHVTDVWINLFQLCILIQIMLWTKLFSACSVRYVNDMKYEIFANYKYYFEIGTITIDKVPHPWVSQHEVSHAPESL